MKLLRSNKKSSWEGSSVSFSAEQMDNNHSKSGQEKNIWLWWNNNFIFIHYCFFSIASVDFHLPALRITVSFFVFFLCFWASIQDVEMFVLAQIINSALIP